MYLTTAVDYPNAKPHIGTAFEKIGADVYARYQSFFRGENVFLLMGNDENTIKVSKRAQELGEDPKVYVDRMAKEFQVAWEKLDIHPSKFIQTTEESHAIGVKEFLTGVFNSRHIYKKRYTGLYCDGCEAFKTSKEIVNDCCPSHPKQELREVHEENWFFELSAFKERLLSIYRERDMKIEPESRWNEIVSFVENDLHDISISRRNMGWGIPIPWDETQVTYVWFDALLSYLTGIGFGTDWDKFYKYWPADVHFIGKDITRFHCALFPAMIMAYNEGQNRHIIDRPVRIFAHGFVYQKQGNELVKSSKSGLATDPIELVDKFGADAYRYYFMRYCDYGSDGEYSHEHMVESYNTDLANNLGNLVSRVVGMMMKYFDGARPEEYKDTDKFGLGNFLVNYHDRYKTAMEQFKYRDALVVIWEMLRYANGFIEQEKPWDLFKTDKRQCFLTLKKCINILRVVSVYLKPFMPSTAQKIYNSFIYPVSWEGMTWQELEWMVWMNREGLWANPGVNLACLVEGRYLSLFQRIVGEN